MLDYGRRARARRGQRGAVMTITLMFLVILLVVVTAWLNFAVRQSHQVVDQEQEEQAFHIAEAGVEYTLFLLNSGTYAPTGLISEGSLVRAVSDSSGNIIGAAELSFQPGGAGVPLKVSSLGHDLTVERRCQLITAEAADMTGAVGGTRYYVRSWDHELDVECGALGLTTSLPNVKFDPSSPLSVNEGDPPDDNQAPLTVVLSHEYPLRVTVDFATQPDSATAGQDYVSKTETVVFDPGQTSKMIMVDIVADTEPEGNESFQAVLSDPVNANLTVSTRQVRILDDD